MVDKLIGANFIGAERAYFEWSNQVPPPDVWSRVEAPALTSAFTEVVHEKGKKLKVLDIGVGGGKMLGLLEGLGVSAKNITGIDLNSKMLKLVAEIQPEVTLLQADVARKASLSKLTDRAPFDVITASMVLNHLSDRRLKHAVDNIFNLLKDGGSVIALVPYPGGPEKIKGLEVQKTGVTKVENAPWGGRVIYHHRAFMLYHEIFERSGFYMHLRVELKPGSKFPNRLLICGIKNMNFRNLIERERLGVKTVNMRAYTRSGQ